MSGPCIAFYVVLVLLNVKGSMIDIIWSMMDSGFMFNHTTSPYLMYENQSNTLAARVPFRKR